MSDDEKGYNGWKNYETWSVALIVDNDEGTYTMRRSIVGDVASEAERCPQVEEGIWSEEEARRFMVADALRDWITEEVPTAEMFEGPFAYLWDQLLGAALDDVDWQEIAEAWLADLEEVS